MTGPVLGPDDFVGFMRNRASRLRNLVGPQEWSRIRSVSSTRLRTAVSRLRDLMMRRASLGPTQVGTQAEIRALQGQIQRAMARGKARTIVMRTVGQAGRSGGTRVMSAARPVARQGIGAVLRSFGPALAHPVTVMAVVAVILVGIGLNYRSGGFRVAPATADPNPDSRFIGPAGDSCAEDVMASHGFIWGGEAEGWRAPSSGFDYEEPILADYQSPDFTWRMDEYEEDMDAWETAIRQKLEPALAEAREDCGPESVGELPPGEGIKLPVPEEVCFFMPENTVPVPASAAIHETSDMSAICVHKDNLGHQGVKLWAEIIAYEDAFLAIERKSGYSGGTEDLAIGDGARLYRQSDRDILVGTAGPLLYYLFACNECADTMAPQLPALAQEIVDNYLFWLEETL
jgi:hypothetical protein